jgi:hypothetical protein
MLIALSLAALVLLALCAFLTLLVRKDITPRIAIEKLYNRLAKRPPALLPNFHDAPYRRLPGKIPQHHPTILNIQTSEGTGQACHPDVAYAPEGFGTERWRYWMACTPLAYCNFVFENPEIFASHDGIAWTVPEGARNPIIPSPKGMWDHNSDPDLLFVGQELWLYYRETRRSASPEHRIFLVTSEDGVQWTSPREVVVETGDPALLMCPAVVQPVVQQDSVFHMFTIGSAGTGLQLARRESVDGLTWSQPVPCSIVGLPNDRQVWHVDVIPEADRLSAIFVSAKSLSAHRLHYGVSRDAGLTWQTDGFLLDPAYEFEEGFLYRTTLLKRPSERDAYDIWYSAANRRDMFSIAYLRMIRDGDKLRPASLGFGGRETHHCLPLSGSSREYSIVDSND